MPSFHCRRGRGRRRAGPRAHDGSFELRTLFGARCGVRWVGTYLEVMVDAISRSAAAAAARRADRARAACTLATCAGVRASEARRGLKTRPTGF